MPAFSIRVELHGATGEQYDDLHEAMARHGIIRTIVGDTGRSYDLPEAEYNLPSASLTAEQIRDVVLHLATAVKPLPGPWVWVTEARERAWVLRVRS